jgi:hypothetical protein
MGTLVFQATLGGAVNIIGPNIASTINFTLPSADGSSGQTWTTNGSGLLTFGTLGVAGGGTGQTTLATGALGYGQGTSAHASLAIGTAGQILTVNSGATAPQWSTLTGVAVTTFSAGTTGFTPSSATAGAVTLAGTLATTNGGTGLTSFTSGGVVYASSSSALATGSALQFNGTSLGIGSGVTPTKSLTIYNASIDTEIRLQSSTKDFYLSQRNATGQVDYIVVDNAAQTWSVNNTEGMRLTSTGLGIGTSSPFASPKLTVFNSATITTGGDGGGNGVFIAASTGGASSGQLVVAGSDTAAIDKGGAIVFAGKWDTATNDIGQWAKIAGYKENATNNNYSAYLGFFTRANGGAATEKARITSDGNFGLGVTPSAWSGFKALQTTGGAHFFGNAGAFAQVGANGYWNGSNYIYVTSAESSRYLQNAGVHSWWSAASGTAGNPISFTQAMTLDASGNLGVGQTSPAQKLEISITSGSYQMRLGSGTTATAYTYDIGRSSADGYFRFYGNQTGANGYIFGGIDGERARIDSSGNLLVGTTSVNYGGSGMTLSKDSGTTKWLVGPLSGTATSFWIASSGTTGVYLNGTSATSWSSNSDFNLKTDLIAIENAAEKVASLRAVTGRYKTDPEGTSRAFLIAQDVQAVLPEAVAPTTMYDGTEVLGLAYTETIPLLVAAIKEQQAMIESLRQRLSAANL